MDEDEILDKKYYPKSLGSCNWMVKMEKDDAGWYRWSAAPVESGPDTLLGGPVVGKFVSSKETARHDWVLFAALNNLPIWGFIN